MSRRTARWRQLLAGARRKVGLPSPSKSFAQCGEDLILRHLFLRLGTRHPSYVDIGAHDPYHFSNTYLFYRDGACGVLVEPNAPLARRLQRARPRDVCICAGIAPEPGSLTLYVMSSPTLSTFSASEAESLTRQGFRIVDEIETPVIGINDFLANQAPRAIDLLSIDVEGMDEAILSAMDMDRHRPRVLCVESVEYSTQGQPVRRETLLRLLESRGYRPYADSGVNSILVDARSWT